MTRSFVWKLVIPVVALAVGCGPAAQTADESAEFDLALAGAEVPEGRAFMPNQLLVQFTPGASEATKSSVRAALGATAVERIHTSTMQRFGEGELHLMHLAPGSDVSAAARGVEGNTEVQFAEPNYIVGHSASSNDPYYTDGLLWGMYGDATSPANQYGSQAGEAWAGNHTGSRTIVVGVIDEGIQVDHPDLSANIWNNPYDPVDGVDNDGNGYTDDTWGWDFVNNDRTVYDGGKRGSTDKHGTHVAGTIGAIGGNGAGVVGVNWAVTMISAKFLGRNGGTTANAIRAVDYITDLKTRHGIDIVATNNSWGGGGYSQGLYDAIERANRADILFMAAAGNGGNDGVGDDNDVTPHYPSSYENTNIIAVASITSTGAKSGFSNYGANSVDLGAPGSGIYSTLPYNTYGSYSGTSMATPHVAGGAALYAASNAARGATLKSAIMNSTVPTASLSGKCVSGGRLNVSGF